MNNEQFAGVLRTLLAFAAGYVPVAVLDAGTTAQIVGGVVTVGVALWSVYSKRLAPPVAPPVA